MAGFKRSRPARGRAAATSGWALEGGTPLFENTPLARRAWTGLDDEHLASIGFVNFAWNALERKFASLVWVTAGWTQEAGELVIASLGNVSLVTLFVNLLKQELKRREDRQIWEQGAATGVLFDEIRAARNDIIHCFFDCDPMTGIEGHFKGSARKGRSGQAELRTVAMGKSDIDDMCFAISDCFESVDSLTTKIWFRRRLLAAKRPPSAAAYEQTVHGWQDPPFDVKRLRTYPSNRSHSGSGHRRGENPQRSLDGHSPDASGAGPRLVKAGRSGLSVERIDASLRNGTSGLPGRGKPI